MNRKTLAGLAAATIAFGTGGVVVADNTIDPYVVKDTKLEITKESALPAAGQVKTAADTTQPRVEIAKWGGQATIGITYEGMASTTEGSRPFLKDTVEWDDGTQKMEMVPLPASAEFEDGGMEINIHLTSKPASPTFAFKIDGSEGMYFDYQLPLDEEDNPDVDHCTPTQCFDKEGNIKLERPEDVIGSFIISSMTKKNQIAGQTNYGNGTIAIIKRPFTIDGKGNKEWASLSFENGVVYATIDPKVYGDPTTDWSNFIVDPTFGYTSIGASTDSLSSSDGNFQKIYLPETGTIQSVFYYGRDTVSTNDTKAMIYDSDGAAEAINTFVAEGSVVTVSTTLGWWESTFGSTTLAPKHWYLGAVSSGNVLEMRYDSTTQRQTYASTNVPYTSPTSPPGSLASVVTTRNYSIYATYTAPSRTVDTSAFTYCRTITSNNNGYTNGIATTTTGLFPLIATSTISTLAATSSSGNVKVLDSLLNTPIDVVFVDEATCSFGASSTAIPHFFEKYASSTGQFVVHLGTSNISSTTAKTLAMYYGNSAFTTNLNSPGQTYATTSPLAPVGVWTLGLAGTATTTYPDFLDSTYNGNDGSSQKASSTVASTGVLDGGWEGNISGSNKGISVAQASTINNLFQGSTSTLSLWFYMDPVAQQNSLIGKTAGGSSGTWNIGVNNAGGQQLRIAYRTNATSGFWTSAGGSVVSSKWYYLVFKYNITGLGLPEAYLNGVKQTLTPVSVPTGSPLSDAAFPMWIANTDGQALELDGKIDQVGLYTYDFFYSDSQTKYNNERDSAAFWSFSAEQTQAAGGAANPLLKWIINAGTIINALLTI